MTTQYYNSSFELKLPFLITDYDCIIYYNNTIKNV